MTISGFSSRIASDASCFLTHGPLSPRDPLSVAIMVIVTIGSCRSPDNKELAHNRNIIVFFSLISHLQAAQVFEEKCLKMQHSQHALEEENEPQVKRRSGQETDWDSKINVHCRHPPEKVSKLPKTTPLWEALSSICSNQLLLAKTTTKSFKLGSGFWWQTSLPLELSYLKVYMLLLCPCSQTDNIQNCSIKSYLLKVYVEEKTRGPSHLFVTC